MQSGRTLTPKPLKIAFVHLDLGIGGAERLVVDAALELQNRGHSVNFFTSHHDTSHAFEETVDGTLSVSVIGSWIPRGIFGRLIALFSYIRMFFIALYLLIFRYRAFDVVFVDQVSACIPPLKLMPAKVAFYCHFPDKLLATRSVACVGGGRQNMSFLKRVYRLPLNVTEEITTGMADLIMVNSRFTQDVFREQFTFLRKKEISVLYPCVELSTFTAIQHRGRGTEGYTLGEECSQVAAADFDYCLLSINRFERKKNLPLALESLSKAILSVHAALPLAKRLVNEATEDHMIPAAHALDQDGLPTVAGLLAAEALRKGTPADRMSAPSIGLVFAGGYDPNVPENAEVHRELVEMARDKGLADSVYFVRSFSASERDYLLGISRMVLYTPEREHFGIVPVEAMAAGLPVLACNSGGPLESVADGETGLLLAPEPEAWGRGLLQLCLNEDWAAMSASARRRTAMMFSRGSFGDRLEAALRELVTPKGKKQA